MANPRWNLTASPHRKVFREIVRVLKSDATLSRVVRSWQVWEGTPDDLRDFAISERPAIRLTPSEGPNQFWGPADQASTLTVRVAVHMPGTDADDAFDLYWAVIKALYPDSDAQRSAIHVALVAAGARAMYTLEFNQPAFAPVLEGDNGPYFTAYGSIRVQVLELTNP